MPALFSAVSFRSYGLGALLALGARASLGQTSPPPAYEFLTVTTIESERKSEAKILILPAFQGKTEIPLATGSLYVLSKNDFEKIAQNTLLINQQLSDLTAAGWELFQTYPVAPASGAGYTPPVTRYLFRKVKR